MPEQLQKEYPHFDIIEAFTKGKRQDQSLNEDGYLVTDDFVAVIDGCTNVSGKVSFLPSPGIAARRTIEDVIKNIPEDQKDIDSMSMRGLFDKAQQAKYEDNLEYFRSNPLYRLQAMAILYSAARHEIWYYGDCQSLVNGEKVADNSKKIDQVLTDLRSFEFQYAMTYCKDERQASDIAMQAIMPFLRQQVAFSNKGDSEYGYQVLDGFSNPEMHPLVLHVKPGDEIVFASDGYPVLCPTLEESEKTLKNILMRDPHVVYEHKQVKDDLGKYMSYDDRAYIRFKIKD